MDPFISVVVPLRNEEAHVEKLVRSLLDQDYPTDRYEVLVADGGSDDRTLEVLRAADVERRVRVFANPAMTAPAALNRLIREARGEVIVRVDGHSWVARDYFRRIVTVMEETGEQVVGGPVLMMPDTPFRTALAEALYASIGVGSVPYRTLRHRAYVESLQTGAFRREVLERVGAFDEALAVVEDVDLNTRIRKAGHRLLLDPSIRFWYVPRASVRALWRQIHRVGFIKVAVLRKHPDIVRPKYLVPSTFVIGLAVSCGALVAGTVSSSSRLLAAGVALPIVYAGTVLALAVSRWRRLGWAAAWLVVIVPVLHIGYGTGFLRGILSGRWQAAPRLSPARSPGMSSRG